MKLCDYIIDGTLLSPGQIMMNKKVFDIVSRQFYKLPLCESTARYFAYNVNTGMYTFRPNVYIDTGFRATALKTENLYIKDKMASLLYE